MSQVVFSEHVPHFTCVFPKTRFLSVFKVLGLKTWSIVLPSENLLDLLYG